ncbi:unnamed protein product [Caenorhabditis brenneri]
MLLVYFVIDFFADIAKALKTKDAELINSWLSDDCHIQFSLCSMVIVDLAFRRNNKITMEDIFEFDDKIIFIDHTIDLTYDKKRNF